MALQRFFFSAIDLNLYKYLSDGSVGKQFAYSARDSGDLGLIPGSGRAPGGGLCNSLQYSCLENPLDRGAWQARVHRDGKSCTYLK